MGTPHTSMEPPPPLLAMGTLPRVQPHFQDSTSQPEQIVSAVQYCHQKKIVHRDLKAENLLLDADMNIKIADFGFSNEFTVGSKLDTFCGSPPYAAPELFQGKKYDGPEVDVWSLGVILYTLVSGSLPFDGQNLKELRERVLRGKYRIPFYMSTDCENLLKRLLVLNPIKRGSLEQIMKDRWMNMGHEEEELQPYAEPEPDFKDNKRIELMVTMGFPKDEITEALVGQKYDEVMATYLLLGRKTPENSREFQRIPQTQPAMAQLYTSIALFLRHAADAKIPRSVMQVAKVVALPSPCKVVDASIFPKISGGKLKIVPNPVEKRARGSADLRKRIASHAKQRQSQIQSDGSIGIQEKFKVDTYSREFHRIPENTTDTTSDGSCSVAQPYTSIALFLRHAADARISGCKWRKVLALPSPCKVVDAALFPKISGGKLKIAPKPVEKWARGSADPRKQRQLWHRCWKRGLTKSLMIEPGAAPSARLEYGGGAAELLPHPLMLDWFRSYG
ncbi:hypothetical protein NFI96_009647 [Prochilodus magdalenae]|nr:hypothetical protein NFI96_009647 [Prochilodus magdalenae]